MSKKKAYELRIMKRRTAFIVITLLEGREGSVKKNRYRERKKSFLIYSNEGESRAID